MSDHVATVFNVGFDFWHIRLELEVKIFSVSPPHRLTIGLTAMGFLWIFFKKIELLGSGHVCFFKFKEIFGDGIDYAFVCNRLHEFINSYG